MKKVSKIFIYISMIGAIVILLAFGFFIKNSRDIFFDYYNQQLNNYSSVFRKTIEIASNYTEVYDRTVADDLYYRISSLNQDLEDVPLDAIHDQMLEDFKEKYDLFGVALLAQDSHGIYIHNSTIPEEIGERTEEWGYWNLAFETLLAGGNPNNQEENFYDNYWIGPRSKSYYEPDYFWYAYFYNQEQDYLINAMIQDNNTYGGNITNMLDEFFDHLYKEVSYIEAVSLIDLSAWEKAYYNDFKNPEAPAFLYGNFDRDILIQTGLTPEDLYSIEYNKIHTFDYKGKDTTIFMISDGEKDHRFLISILVNDQQERAFIRYTVSGVIVLLIFILGIIFYIINRYKDLLTFQMERNEEIERFTKNVAMLPEITYKCRLQNGELLLTYNYGESMDENHKVSLESIYRPMREVYSEEYVKIFREATETVFEGKSKRFEITYNNNHYEHFVSPIFDNDGSVIEIIGIANNITDRRIEEEQAKYFATHDALTNLINRRTFEVQVNEQINDVPDGSYAMMLIDLDGFKGVNDNHGHIAGDLVLRRVADRIKDAVGQKSSDIVVARMGGDELTVFAPFSQIQDIIDIANDIVVAVSKPYVVQDGLIRLGASIGISIYPKDTLIYKQLIHYADVAMYGVKRSGGNGYQFFSENMDINTT